jgi:hypothetical protein
MKKLERELEAIRSNIERLKIEEATVVRLLRAIKNEPDEGAPVIKKRAANVKPLVLDILSAAGAKGATSAEVHAKALERIENVSRDTISSVLSRLKADGALRYDGERYLVKEAERHVGASPVFN